MRTGKKNYIIEIYATILNSKRIGCKLYRNQNKLCCKNPKLEIIGLIIQNSLKKKFCLSFFSITSIVEDNTPVSTVKRIFYALNCGVNLDNVMFFTVSKYIMN